MSEQRHRYDLEGQIRELTAEIAERDNEINTLRRYLGGRELNIRAALDKRIARAASRLALRGKA